MPTTQINKDVLLNRKQNNYPFLIAFFLIFSFFVLFAIKPNLETALKLRKELQGLREIDKNYNDAIAHIILLQTTFQTRRDDLPLLVQALPEKPEIQKIIEDIQKSASGSGMTISKLSVSEVDLKKNNGKKTLPTKIAKSYQVNFETDTQFNTVQQLMSGFITQRRIKLIKNLDIRKNNQQNASSSADLHISFELEGYYL